MLFSNEKLVLQLYSIDDTYHFHWQFVEYPGPPK